MEKNIKKQRKPMKKADNICPYAKKCGGCDYQGMDYKKQLETKEENVKKLLRDFVKVSPIVGMENPYHYRHKVHAVFDCVARGQVVAGVYKKNSHDVVDIDNVLCMFFRRNNAYICVILGIGWNR